MKKNSVLFLLCFMTLFVCTVENVDFMSKTLTVGKASLTEGGFLISKIIGVANFSPELRLPIQTEYHSTSEKTGMFGFGWRSPQLESSAYYDKDGCLWISPWGEKIKFFSKKENTPKDAIKIELYEQAKKGNGFYAPYSDWEVAASSPDKQLSQSGDWIISGKRKYTGWRFVYRDAQLKTITAPSGRSISFEYTKSCLTKIVQDGKAFVEFVYDGKQVVSVKINGIESKLTYVDGDVIILPKTMDGKRIHAKRPRLISIRTGDLNPVQFEYKGSYLGQIKQGNFIDDLDVQTETLSERLVNIQSADRKS